MSEKWKKTHQKFTSLINKCGVCYFQYNLNKKQPVIICIMHHTICRQCLDALLLNKKCPFCRLDIDQSKAVINNYIYQLLPNDPQQQNIIQVKQESPKIEITRKYTQEITIRKYLQKLIGWMSDKLLFWIFNMFHLLSMVINFHFFLDANSSQCHDTNGLVGLQKWYLAMVIIQAFILFPFSIIMIFNIRNQLTQCLFFLLVLLATFVIYFWTVVQIILLFTVIFPFCSGGLFIYEIIQSTVYLITSLLLIIRSLVILCVGGK